MGFDFDNSSGIRIRVGKTTDEVEAQMDRIVERIGRRMGIGAEWDVRFHQMQDDLSIAIGMVYPNENSLHGGQIVLDNGIFCPGHELQRLPLRSRTQALLVHEVTEGEHMQALRQLGIARDAVEVQYTHNASISFSPSTELQIFPEARSYLKRWMDLGPYDSGIR